MFGKQPSGKTDYRQVSLEDFSDDDDQDDLTESSRQRQQEQIKIQDEGLEMLSQSAQRLGHMSLAISEELSQQNQMLDEMDADLDEADQNLDLVTRKTKEFIEKAGGTRNFLLIVALCVVILILFFLIIYT